MYTNRELIFNTAKEGAIAICYGLIDNEITKEQAEQEIEELISWHKRAIDRENELQTLKQRKLQ